VTARSTYNVRYRTASIRHETPCVRSTMALRVATVKNAISATAGDWEDILKVLQLHTAARQSLLSLLASKRVHWMRQANYFENALAQGRRAPLGLPHQHKTKKNITPTRKEVGLCRRRKTGSWKKIIPYGATFLGNKSNFLEENNPHVANFVDKKSRQRNFW